MNSQNSDRFSLREEARQNSKLRRLVVGAVLSFSLAIALPFISLSPMFPLDIAANSDRVSVVVDGQPLPNFRVTDTVATSSAAARAEIISNSLQPFADAAIVPDIEVEEPIPDGLATVWLRSPEGADRELAPANFTVTREDARGMLSPSLQAEIWASQLRDRFIQSREQRQPGYFRQHLWQVIAVPTAAAIAYWLSGIFWRKYLFRAIRLVTSDGTNPERASKSSPFTAANLFLNTTLLLLRLGIWTSALLYVTNLFPKSRQKSHQIVSQLADTFTNNTIPLGNNPISILNIFQVLLLVLLVFLMAQIIANAIKRRILQETGINRGVQEAIAVLLRYGLIFIGTLIVLQASGINLSSLTILASALGVGAGLGLQNIVKDIGSGLVLVFERPVQVGEFVQIGEQTGTVERIGARSAEIRTLDQISIIVPNSQFLEQEVINWSHRNPISRIRIPVGVSYKSDPEEVRDLLLKTGKLHSDVLSSPPPQVLFCRLGDSAFEFELLVWVAQPSRQFIIKSDLLFKIVQAFRQHDIEIPYPQRDLHIVSSAVPLPKNLQ